MINFLCMLVIGHGLIYIKTNFNYKIGCNLRLQFYIISINIIIYFKFQILIVGLHVPSIG